MPRVRRPLPFLLLASLALGACAIGPVRPHHPGLKAQISVLSQPGADLVPPKRLALAAPVGEQPLLNQRAAELALDALRPRGYQALSPGAEAAPELLVRCQLSASEEQELVPEKREKETYYQEGRSETISRVRNNRLETVVRDIPGAWKTRVKMTPATTRAVQQVRLVLDLLPPSAAAAGLSGEAAVLPLWEGTAQARSPQSDPLAVAPELLRQLAQRLPKPRPKAAPPARPPQS